jgi:hypothetical protein
MLAFSTHDHARQHHAPRLAKDFSLINIGDFLPMREIQRLFHGVPVDPYVPEGFRRKSLFRAVLQGRKMIVTDHAPLYQPVEFNPVHGGIYRHYQAMDARLAALLAPMAHIFGACAGLDETDEILVQAQRITAEQGKTGLPVVEGWHQDDIQVLGILLVNRSNVSGGVSLLSRDRGKSVCFEQQLKPGDFLLINDTVMWHNTTPIKQMNFDLSGFRDIVIITSPTNRPPATAPSEKHLALL